AVMTGHAPVVLAREDGGATDRQAPLVAEILLHYIFHVQFGAIHFHRWKEFAVGELGETFGLTCDADELFNVVVPRLNVAVADGPIDRDAVAGIGFKIEIAPAITLPAPHNRAAAYLAPTNPAIWLVGRRDVRIVFIADEELGGPFVPCVAG